ncbi:MAG TPA: BON domain-containing protein [Candidatus Polarisedimenticolia bacterium]|nr:BON domain-containing protein [Candidatus Polarisedimenticolia bacterium]
MSSRGCLSLLLPALLTCSFLGCAEDLTTDASVVAPPGAWEDCDDIRDVSLTARLNTLYLVDPYVDASRIAVETHACVVTLRGRVPDPGTRDRAGAMARETDGVRQVRNRLEVVATVADGGRY